MTELEYVLDGFEQKLSPLKDKRILLHGSRNYAGAIADRFSDSFSFIGLISNDSVDKPVFHGIPVFEREELGLLDVDVVLLTERVKYAEEVYQSIHGLCEQRNILIYNMYGVNESETHRELEACRYQSVTGWRKICLKYDVVAFEVMDTILINQNSQIKLEPRKTMISLIRWLFVRGVDVRFSLRKSYDEEVQIAALEESGLCSDLKTRLIRRRGEDLSFRRLKDENPGKRILYIGIGLVNECMLPRCYGIDTYRFVHSQPQLNWYMPVGNADNRVSYNSRWKEQICQCIREKDIISFDIFDTLVVRRTLEPGDVFDLVEKRLEDKGIPIDGFAEDRRVIGSKHPYANVHEIYSILKERRNWSESFSHEVMDLELDTERDVIIPRTEVIELFLFAVQKRKKVVLTSDMYLPADVLIEFMEFCGISGYDHLLVSCDYRKDKRSGLYYELIKLYGNKEGILHIGDDPVADGEMCKNAGISSILLPSPLSLAFTNNWENCILSVNTLMERCLLGMCIAELFRDPFQNPNIQDRPLQDRLRRFAVSVVFPLSVGFITWLVRELRTDPCDGVLFLARDGYFLRLIYQSICLRSQLPPSFYYYTSRHAAFLCCADKEDYLPYVVSQCKNTGLNAHEILEQIYDLDKSQIKTQLEGETEEAYVLRHIDEISEIAMNERNAVQVYSNRVGLKQNGRYAVVDCIAAGTTQWFMEAWMPYQFFGYYLGNCNPGGRKCSNIKDYLKFDNDSLLMHYIEIESYFSSDESSVRSICANGEPAFFNEKRKSHELEELRIVHQFALQYIKTFFDLFYSENEIIDSVLPEEMFAADGCHWVQNNAYDDWTGKLIPTKEWENG